jgi:hypothetical protein
VVTGRRLWARVLEWSERQLNSPEHPAR